MRKWISLAESLNQQSIPAMKAFVFEKWKERAEERRDPEPHDLTGACKFAAMFAQAILGGTIMANDFHTWLEVNGQIIDLAEDASDAKALKAGTIPPDMIDYAKAFHIDLPEDIYEPDEYFMDLPDFKDALEANRARIEHWVKEWNREPLTERAVPKTEYGYWITETGEFLVVDRSHAATARDHGTNFGEALHQGWIRIVVEANTLSIYYQAGCITNRAILSLRALASTREFPYFALAIRGRISKDERFYNVNDAMRLVSQTSKAAIAQYSDDDWKAMTLTESYFDYEYFINQWADHFPSDDELPDEESVIETTEWFIRNIPNMPLYRGIKVTEAWLDNLTEQTPLGIYWSCSDAVARTFAESSADVYDDRFEGSEGPISVILEIAPVTVPEVDLIGTVGSSYVLTEEEIRLKPSTDVKLVAIEVMGQMINHPLLGKYFPV